MELNREEKMTNKKRLGNRIKRFREKRGLSQRQLCEMIGGFPHSYLGRVERGVQLPSEAFVDKLEEFFDADGVLKDLWEVAQEPSISDYAREVIDKEKIAIRIQVFDSSTISGPLQTENYAWAMSRASHPTGSDDELNDLVAGRMGRKHIFERENPPFFLAIMDESALKRPIGSNQSMCDQLDAVLKAAESPHIVVQILPFNEREHPMMGGSLVLLDLENGDTLGYVESFRSGEYVESPRKIIELMQLFDVVRSKALPKEASLQLIRAYRREYSDEA